MSSDASVLRGKKSATPCPETIETLAKRAGIAKALVAKLPNLALQTLLQRKATRAGLTPPAFSKAAQKASVRGVTVEEG